MEILKILQKQSKYFVPFLVLLSIINCWVYFGLLGFVNQAVKGNAAWLLPGYDGIVYTLLIAISLVSTKVFQTFMVRLTHQLLLDYELSILQKLRFAAFRDFEQLGAQQVYTAIADVRILVHIPEVVVAVVNSTVIITCALGYLFWVSPPGALTVLALMSGLLLFYLFRNKKIEKDLNTVRDLQNDYHRYLRDLLYGFREIKMSANRNDRLYEQYLKQNRLTGKALGVRSAIRYLDNELTGTYSWYIALGIAIFVLPGMLHLSQAATIPFIVVTLYLMGPLASVVKVMPYYTNVKIALERIHAIQQTIDAKVTGRPGALPAEAQQPFSSLSFKDVVFEYFDEKMQQTFRVGPLNVEIAKGEVVFVTGGNGSGKSTFVHLLTGLYQPISGQILLNGRPVSHQQYAYYSNLVAAVFTNHHLFSENYDGFDLRPENRELQELIDMMQLSAVLRLDAGRRFIDPALSRGQQKRLALIYAIMEHRDVLVLDEWAAEQDPLFRAYFYKTILPALKKKGKTIIAVTHDDFYFDRADRMLKFDYGRIVADERLAPAGTTLLFDKILEPYEQD